MDFNESINKLLNKDFLEKPFQKPHHKKIMTIKPTNNWQILTVIRKVLFARFNEILIEFKLNEMFCSGNNYKKRDGLFLT